MRRYSAVIAIASLLAFGGPAIAKEPAAPLTVHAEQNSGHEYIHVSGKGPATTQVRLYSSASISRDLPEIGLGDNNGLQYIVTDQSGNFETNVSLAGLQWQSTPVKIEADVPNTRMRATASIVLEAVSRNVKHPQADVLPKK